MWQSDRKGLEVPDPRQKNPKHPITTLPCVMHDYFHARTRVHSAITLTATLALMLCFLYVRDSTSLLFNATYRIERCLLFWASVASSRKCRDRLGTRRKFRVNRPDFQHIWGLYLMSDELLRTMGARWYSDIYQDLPFAGFKYKPIRCWMHWSQRR